MWNMFVAVYKEHAMAVGYKMKLWYALYKVSYTLFVLMLYHLLVQESFLSFKNGTLLVVSLLASVVSERYYQRAVMLHCKEQSNEASQ